MMDAVDQTDPTPLLEEGAGEDGREPSKGEGDLPSHLWPQPEEEARLVSTMGAWWKNLVLRIWQFRFLLGVLFANFCSWVLVQHLLMSASGLSLFLCGEEESCYEHERNTIRTGLVIRLITYLWDAYLCFRGATRMETKWKKNGGEATTSTSADTSSKWEEFDLEEFSQRVDANLGTTSSNSSTTFVVGLLFAVWALSAWQAVEAGTGLVQVQLMEKSEMGEKRQCFTGGVDDYDENRGIRALQNAASFTTLPTNVQEWIKRAPGRYCMLIGGLSSDVFNQSVPYLQLADGTLVFSKNVGDRWSLSTSNSKKQTPGIAVYTPSTNSVQEYLSSTANDTHNVWRRDEEVELVGFRGPTAQSYHGWCAIFKSDEPSILLDEAVCYNSKTGRVGRFDVVTGTNHERGTANYRFFMTDDVLWMATIRRVEKKTRDFNRLTLVSYDIGIMQKKVVLSAETTDFRNSGGSTGDYSSVSPTCVKFFWSTKVVSIFVLTLLSAYLYYHDISSSAVPASSAITILVRSLLPPTVAGLVLLALASSSLCLLVGIGRTNRMLRKYISVQMLVWALYAFQLAAFWLFWFPWLMDEVSLGLGIFLTTLQDDSFGEVFLTMLIPLLSLLVAAATNVMLNHPFLQVLSVCFGSLSVVSVIYMVMMGLNSLIISLILLATALGCFQAGTLLQTYRVHLIVHCRWLFRTVANLFRRFPIVRPQQSRHPIY